MKKWIESKRIKELIRLEKEMDNGRMTTVEAIAAIAERFGVEPSVYDCEHENARLILRFAWRDCEAKMLSGMEAKDVHQYLLDGVESQEMDAAEAVKLYCVASDLPPKVLIAFATERCGWDAYDTAFEAIGDCYDEKDISHCIADLDARWKRREKRTK